MSIQGLTDSQPALTEAGWLARLAMSYAHDGERTVLQHQHDGPLRVLKSLYPESPHICHNVLIHPPSGLVGSDRVEVQVSVQAGAHALVTTPGATRFLGRSEQWASQRLRADVAAGARLEWLPMETVVYPGAHAHNALSIHLAPSAEVMYWDVYALGLKHSGQPFQSGRLWVHTEIEGQWLEQFQLEAHDDRLMHSRQGLQGHTCMGQMVLARGLSVEEVAQLRPCFGALAEATQQHLATAQADGSGLGQAPGVWGLTEAQPGVLTLRALADEVRDLRALFECAWQFWRREHWGLRDQPPRMWAL